MNEALKEKVFVLSGRMAGSNGFDVICIFAKFPVEKQIRQALEEYIRDRQEVANEEINDFVDAYFDGINGGRICIDAREILEDNQCSLQKNKSSKTT
jgi:hypothetical protein